MSTAAKPISITTVSDGIRVSGLLQKPPRARACYVLAHGAGAGMDHPFMENVARGLASRGIATLRYQFPYMERGTRRPDPPPLAQATVRAAVAAAQRLLPDMAAHRRRQVVRRPDDVTSAGESSARGRARIGIPRISAASGRSAVAGPRRTSVRGANSDALPAGHAR